LELSSLLVPRRKEAESKLGPQEETEWKWSEYVQLFIESYWGEQLKEGRQEKYVARTEDRWSVFRIDGEQI